MPIDWDKVREKNGLSSGGIDWEGLRQKHVEPSNGKELWEYVNQDKNRLLKLNEEGKKTYFQYGYDSKQLDLNKITDEAKKYITMAQPKLPKLEPKLQQKKPTLGTTLKNILDMQPSGNKLADSISNFGRVSRNAFIGSKEGDKDYLKPIDTGSKLANVGTGIAGTMAGLVAPINAGQSIMNTGIKSGEQLLSKVGSKVTKPLTKHMIRGAGAGLAIDVSQGLKENDTPKELATRALVGAGIGAAFDVTTFGAGKLISKYGKDFFSKWRAGAIPPTEVDDIVKELGLPEGTTAENFMKEMEHIARETDAENYYNTLSRQLQESNKVKKVPLARPKPNIANELGLPRNINAKDYARQLELEGQAETYYKQLENQIQRPLIEPPQLPLPKPQQPQRLTPNLLPKVNKSIDITPLRPPKIEPSSIPPLRQPIPKIEPPQINPRNLRPGQEVNLNELARQQEIVGSNASPARIEPLIQSMDEAAATSQGIEPLTFPKRLPGKLPTLDIEDGIGAPKLRSFPQTLQQSNATAAELKQLINDNPQRYQPRSNEETLKVVKEIVDKNFSGSKQLVMEGNRFNSNTESAMALEVVKRLQDNKQWDEAFEVMSATSRKFTNAGRDVQSAAMWRKMTPEGMSKYALRVVDQANEQLPVGNKLKLSNELQERIVNGMKEIELMEDGIEKDKATALILDDIASQVPSSLGRKISTFQAISHLLNGKTILRNIFGNTSFSIAETVSNMWAMPFDKAISLKTGNRTVSMPTFKDPLKAGLERAAKSANDIKLGIDSTLVESGKYDLFKGQTFRTGPLSKLEKALSYSLKVPDELFKGFRQKQALQQMTKMAGLTEPTSEMIEQAAHEARYATFQDNSLPATLLQGFKELANKIPLGKISGKLIPGQSLKTTREFGVGDLIVKYTRVPGNLISRSVEYTPMGTLKALNLMAEAKKSGVLNQRELSLTLGRTMTGTSMIGLGAWLHNKGLIIGEDKDADRDARALDRAEGLGNYKVNISALKRILGNGDTKPQPGDELYSYNWNQPVSVAFAIGSTIDQEYKKMGITPQLASKISGNSMDEILDLPTLFIIQKMFYEGMSSDSNPFTIATVPIAEGLPGFIPSTIRQTAQLTDPIARNTKGKSILENTGLKIKNNLPGLKNTLLPKLNAYGEKVQYPTGLGTNLLNPANKSIYLPKPFTPKLKQLEKLTGENKHYPTSTPVKSFSKNKIEYDLTPEEQNKFQEVAGQEILRLYENILGNKEIEKLSDTQSKLIVKRLADAISNAREKAKKEIIRGR